MSRSLMLRTDDVTVATLDVRCKKLDRPRSAVLRAALAALQDGHAAMAIWLLGGNPEGADEAELQVVAEGYLAGGRPARDTDPAPAPTAEGVEP